MNNMNFKHNWIVRSDGSYKWIDTSGCHITNKEDLEYIKFCENISKLEEKAKQDKSHFDIREFFEERIQEE